MMIQPTHKHIDLLLDVLVFFEIGYYLEKILVSQNTVSIFIKKHKHPKVDESQVGIRCILEKEHVLSDSKTIGKAKKMKESFK